MKHTPGPWKRDGLTVYALQHAGWRKGVEQFGNRFHATVQSGGSLDDHPDRAELEANAKLMELASEMAELLARFVANEKARIAGLNGANYALFAAGQECLNKLEAYDVPQITPGR